MGSFECTECKTEENEAPDKSFGVCETCPAGEKATSGGVCIQTNSQEDAIKGVFANNGTPFYILIVLSLLIGGLGLALFYDKESDKRLVQQPLGKHILQCFFSTAGLISELILAISLLLTGLPSVAIPAGMLLASRFIIAPYPAIVVGYQLFVSTAPLENPDTGEKSLKYYVEGKKMFKGSKAYTLLIVMAVFEPPLLTFLPWYNTPFSDASFFPTLSTMKLCYGVKVLQLIVTFAGQILVVVEQQGTNNEGFKALMYLNITLSLLVLTMKLVEVGMKRNILTSASLSDQCNAADVAATREKSSSASSSSEVEIELASAYPNTTDSGTGTGSGEVTFEGVNPLHNYTSSSTILHANDLKSSTRETDTLLRIESRLADIEVAQQKDAEQIREVRIAQERDAELQQKTWDELMSLKGL